jgi:hypothetical protein
MFNVQWLRSHQVLLILAGMMMTLAAFTGVIGVAVLVLSGPDVVVRVLYAETSGGTARERRLVMGVIRNRVGNGAFGELGSERAVVLQSGAFSCVSGGANWEVAGHPGAMNAVERKAWEDCEACVRGGGERVTGPSGRPLVYYHDKSIGKPASWDNDKWRAVREVVTEHFIFYSVVPEGGRR